MFLKENFNPWNTRLVNQAKSEYSMTVCSSHDCQGTLCYDRKCL